MSFILDALRRAERERAQGHAPRLEDITQLPIAPPRRPLWPLIASAIAALILLTLLGAWLWPKSPAPEAAAAAPTPAAAATEPAATPASAFPPTPAPPGPARAPVDAPVAADDPTQIADADIPEPPPPPTTQGEALASMDDLVPPSDEEAPPPGEDLPADAATTEPFDAAQPAPAQPAPASAAPATQPSPSPQPPAPAVPPPQTAMAPLPSAAPADGLTKLRDMPPAYRADFPKISVDVHAYDDDPARRFVLINMRRFHEGERIDGGAQIVEIVSQGIVFEFRGQKVLYTLNR